MSYIFVGLGNPGLEYKNTRHNSGRILLSWFGKSVSADWKTDKKINAQVAKVKIGKTAVTLILPDTFMNNSGNSLKSLGHSLGHPMSKWTEKMVVIYDDLDLPFGTSKISFNKSSGGHKGLESIIKALKTEKFARIRVGISPTTSIGKTRKPKAPTSPRLREAKEDAVIKFIMGKFKPAELATLKKISKKINKALETFVTSGLQKAMAEFN